MNTATPEIVSSTFLPEGNLLKLPFGSLIFNSYRWPEFLLHSLEKWAVFLCMYEDFFVSSPGYLSLKVLEWFDYLFPHRRLITTDNRPIAGEWRPAIDVLVLWNSNAVLMAEKAFPLKIPTLGYLFYGKTTMRQKVSLL